MNGLKVRSDFTLSKQMSVHVSTQTHWRISGGALGSNFFHFQCTDLPSAPPPDGPKFSQFHAVFLENLAKSYVGAPPGGLTPILQGILDPPLIFMQFSAKILPNNRFSAQTQGLVPLSGKILHCKRASSHS